MRCIEFSAAVRLVYVFMYYNLYAEQKTENWQNIYCKQSLPGLCNVNVASVISTTECFSIHALVSSIQHCELDNKRKCSNSGGD